VGITGRAGAGKDVVANWLVDNRGFTKIALADPMKEFCQKMFGWSRTQLWGSSELRNQPDPRWRGLTPRRALQQLGTEWGRAMHEDVWIRYALDRCYALNCQVVISDVRFQNETALIQQAGGVVIEVRRPTANRGEAFRFHVSEAGVSGADHVIDNDGTLLDLKKKLCLLFPVSEGTS